MNGKNLHKIKKDILDDYFGIASEIN